MFQTVAIKMSQVWPLREKRRHYHSLWSKSKKRGLSCKTYKVSSSEWQQDRYPINIWAHFTTRTQATEGQCPVGSYTGWELNQVTSKSWFISRICAYGLHGEGIKDGTWGQGMHEDTAFFPSPACWVLKEHPCFKTEKQVWQGFLSLSIML